VTPRVRRTFWALVVVAVVSAGALSKALAAEPGAGAGLGVAGSGLLVTTSTLLAVRILLVTGRGISGAERRRH
jgi:hypothetical protein